jgi:hypothetical protein
MNSIGIEGEVSGLIVEKVRGSVSVVHRDEIRLVSGGEG